MITLYTKTTCPYCVKAKNYLNSLNIEYTEVNIEQVDEARSFLKRRGHTSVPQLYKDGELFVKGGCDGLMSLPKDELERRLAA